MSSVRLWFMSSVAAQAWARRLSPPPDMSLSLPLWNILVNNQEMNCANFSNFDRSCYSANCFSFLGTLPHSPPTGAWPLNRTCQIPWPIVAKWKFLAPPLLVSVCPSICPSVRLCVSPVRRKRPTSVKHQAYNIHAKCQSLNAVKWQSSVNRMYNAAVFDCRSLPSYTPTTFKHLFTSTNVK